ncbi:MAG: F-box/LRR-repeat protein [Pseudomonadota bacterium]
MTRYFLTLSVLSLLIFNNVAFSSTLENPKQSKISRTTGPRTTINPMLPKDILPNIFVQLIKDGSLANARMVCKTWNTLPLEIKELRFDEFARVSPLTLKHLSITRLILETGFFRETPVENEAVQGKKAKKKGSFHFNFKKSKKKQNARKNQELEKLTPIEKVKIFRGIEVEKLSIYFQNIDLGEFVIDHNIVHLGIKVIDIRSYGKVKGNITVKDLQHLEELCVYPYLISEAGMYLQTLNLPNLKILDIQRNLLNTLQPIISKLTNLEYLYASWNNFDKADVTAILDHKNTYGSIKYVDFSDNYKLVELNPEDSKRLEQIEFICQGTPLLYSGHST